MGTWTHEHIANSQGVGSKVGKDVPSSDEMKAFSNLGLESRGLCGGRRTGSIKPTCGGHRFVRCSGCVVCK